MSLFGEMLKRHRTERGLSLSRFAELVHYNKGYLSRIEAGIKAPSEAVARQCDDVLDTRGELIAAAHLDIAAARDTKPSYTTELLQRIQTSALSAGALDSLSATVYDLCCQYAHRDAHALRNEAHDWLREISRALRQPTGLRQHRELLVAAGWLALLVGCIEYDLGMRASAEATRITAAQLGAEADAPQIVGWSYEMAAWFALTQGHYRAVLDATQAGIAVAGNDSVTVQLLGQQAKALARLGDTNGVRDALDRGSRRLAAMRPPARNDNHFDVDPDKWDFYAMDAHRIAGNDTLAATHASYVIQQGTAIDGTEASPMRIAEARLTLAVIAARTGNLDEAIHLGLTALHAERRSLPSLLMVAGEVDAALTRRWPDLDRIDTFRETIRTLH